MIADSLDSASRIVMPDCALSIKTCHREKNYHSTYELSSRAERGICSSPKVPPSVSPLPSKGTIKQPRLTRFMYEVTVEDTFAAGHYLRNYKGKCENPHGHNYKVRVTLAGKELDKAGLLIDFKELREVMKHTIERLDHQMINDVEPFTVLNPSAENLAKYFYDEANGRLDRATGGRVRVKQVTVFETDSTTATYAD